MTIEQIVAKIMAKTLANKIADALEEKSLLVDKPKTVDCIQEELLKNFTIESSVQ